MRRTLKHDDSFQNAPLYLTTGTILLVEAFEKDPFGSLAGGKFQSLGVTPQQMSGLLVRRPLKNYTNAPNEALSLSLALTLSPTGLTKVTRTIHKLPLCGGQTFHCQPHFHEGTRRTIEN